MVNISLKKTMLGLAIAGSLVGSSCNYKPKVNLVPEQTKEVQNKEIIAELDAKLDAEIANEIEEKDYQLNNEFAKKVLWIQIDGLRPDALERADTTYLDVLRYFGVYSDQMRTGSETVSGPNWSNQATGVYSNKHGVIDNSFERSRIIEEFPSFIDIIEKEKPTLETRVYSGWNPINNNIFDNADEEVYSAYWNGGDERLTERVVQTLQNDNPDVIVLYLGMVDDVGHKNGFHPDVLEYIGMIEETDVRVGRVLKALTQRQTYSKEDWLIMITTDHGGLKNGKHWGDSVEEPSQEIRRIFYLAQGKSVVELERVPNSVDVAANVLKHVGVVIPDYFDGKPVGLK